MLKIGFLAPFTEETMRFAGEAGFGSVELRLTPESEMNAEKVLAEKGETILRSAERNGLEVSALGHYCNMLDPDEKKRAASSEYMKKLIDAGQVLGVNTVCAFAGRVPELSVEENIPVFKEVFTPLADHAESRGVRIAFENCPMMHTHPFRGINIAYTPYAWDLMFEAVESDYLGLEFDPSHLAWLQIDYLSATRDYGDKIYHVHAKDTEIMYDVLSHKGIFEGGWWRYRIPGWGEVDWQGFVSALLDIGYEGSLAIEHEDPVFSGERFNEGLVRGLKFLSLFMV